MTPTIAARTAQGMKYLEEQKFARAQTVFEEILRGDSTNVRVQKIVELARDGRRWKAERDRADRKADEDDRAVPQPAPGTKRAPPTPHQHPDPGRRRGQPGPVRPQQLAEIPERAALELAAFEQHLSNLPCEIRLAEAAAFIEASREPGPDGHEC